MRISISMDRRIVWIITGALVICNLRICADASASHTTSTKTLSGNYFVFCFPANLHDTGSPPKDRSMSIQLQSASPQLTQVSVSATDISWFEELTLNPGEAISLEAPEDAESSHSDTTSHQNGTIVIVSDHDIFVTAVSFVERSLATFAVPPFGSISGKEFVIAQYLPSPIYPSEIMITSGDSEARVVMHPTDTTDNKLLLDNIPYDEISSDEYVVVLPNHTSIQIRYGHDFTGWKFTASSPISIISAVECLFVVTNTDLYCDHVAAYMPPVDQLGKEFTLAPFIGRTSGYLYRVVAARDQTVVSDSNVGDVLLDATDFHEEKSSVVTTISSNKPVLVVQFAKGFTSDSKEGDPTMIEMPPQEQYVNAISFASFDMSRYSINKNYLNLVIACDLVDGIIFNGEIFDSNDWLDVLTEGSQCAARREIGTTGVHSLSHESQSARFAAFVYGAGFQISYGHALDHSFTQLTCTIPDGVNKTKEVDCKQEEVTIYCPNDIDNQPTDPGLPTAIVTWPDVIANDTTGQLYDVMSDYESGDAFPIGTTEVSYWVEDASENTMANCSFFVTVVDVWEPKPSPNEAYAGRHFVFHFPSNLGPPNRQRSMNILLQSTSFIATSVTIVSPGIKWSEQFILQPNETKSIALPEEVEADRPSRSQQGTITITSDHAILVTALSYALTSLATFPVIPFESAASREFFIASYELGTFSTYPNQLMITAGVNKSNVILKKPSDVPFSKLSIPENYPYFEISEDEVLFVIESRNSLQFRSDVDLTGYQVTSDFPVSLISGGECMYVTSTDNGCDHQVTYMFPVDRLGRQFTIAPFVGRDSGYIFRIVAVRDDTNVTVNVNSSYFDAFLLGAGQFYERNIIQANATTSIMSNKPILVVQFAKGYSTDGQFGDPLMITVPPREQSLNAISFASYNMSEYEIIDTYLNIIISCDQLDGIMFNGDTFLSTIWIDKLIEGDQCIVRKAISSSQVNHITHESPDAKFIAFLYGAGQSISYGHALDHRFTQITCTIPDGVNGTKEVDCGYKEVTIYCPNDINNQPTDPGLPTAIVTWPDVIANDTTGQLYNVTSEYKSGDTFSLGTTEVSYWAKDEDDTVLASCSFAVTVVDLEKPSIICPDNITEYTNSSNSLSVNYTIPAADDNSGYTDPVTCYPDAGSQFPPGETPVECWTSDKSGNVGSCGFFVDVEVVNITCPEDLEVETDAGSPEAVVTWEEPVVSGGKDDIRMVSTHAPGDSFPIGETSVVYVVFDPENETITDCHFIVNVKDTEAPVLVCPVDITSYADGEASTPVAWQEPDPTDNSGELQWTNSSHNSGDIFYIGTTLVTYWAWDYSSNIATCSFAVIIIGRCPEDVTEDEQLGTLSWPATEAGNIADSDQRCPIDTQRGGYGIATRSCNFDDEEAIAKWDDVQDQECGDEREVDLGDLPEVPVVEDNVEEVANELKKLTDNIETIAPDNVNDIADTLENIADVADPSEEVTSSVVEVVGNLLDGNLDTSGESANSSSSIVLSLEQQIEVAMEGLGEVHVVDSNIAVDGLTIESSEEGITEVIGSLTFLITDDGNEDHGDLSEDRVQTLTNENDVPDDLETSIQLPESLFSQAWTRTGKQKVSFHVYQEDSLFISPETLATNWTVAGAVIAADLLDAVNVDLPDPVVIKFLPYQIPDIPEYVQNTSTCVFWDFSLRGGVGDWSSQGCTFIGVDNGRVVCSCNHLTNFAVLMDITGHNLSGAKALALDIITYVGCAVSIGALLITLTIFLGFRKLRSTRQRVILIHFCFSLLFLYVVFISGVDTAVGSDVGCVIVAALIHYFTLTSMMWMGVEARNLYSKLVTVFDPEKDWFMKVAATVAWGVPLVAVGLSLGFSFDSWTFDSYVSSAYCFIKPGPYLYYGLLLPIGLLLLHNFITFFLVMRSLMKVGRGQTKSLKDKYSMISKRLQNAATISVLLGLTWVFGFVAIGNATFMLQLIFCIFNSLQGVLILFLFCLRDEDVKKVLTPCCRSKSQQKSRTDTVTSKSTSLRVLTPEHESTSQIPQMSMFNPSLEVSDT